MRRLSLHLKILAGFAIAIAGIGYFLFTTYKNAQISIEETVEANYQYSIISEVVQILDDMQDIETAYRGYLITDDEKYLEPYSTAYARTKKDLAIIKKHTSTDMSKNNSVNSLSELITQKLSFAEKIISLCRQKKNDEATLYVRSGEGKRIMDNIRTLVLRLENDSRKEIEKSAALRQKVADERKSNFLFLSLIILFVLASFYFVIISDLRSSERVKTDLEKAGTKIRDLYDHSPSGYISVDAYLKIIQINKTALKWLGYEFDEIAGKKNLIAIVSDASKPLLQKLIDNENVSNLEIELEGKKNALPVLLDTVTQRDAHGNIAEKRIMLTDISERKKADEQSQYLATLIDQTSDAIYSTDAKFLIKSWNKAAERIYGFEESEVINKESSLLHRNAALDERKIILDTLEEKDEWHGELTHYKKDGTPLPVYSSITTIRNKDNKLTGYVCLIQDITARKLYEDKLLNFNNELIEKVNEKTEQVVNILNRITDGFISLDQDYNITFMNELSASMVGKKKEELIGKNMTTAFAREDNEIRRSYKKAFETQKKVEIESYYEFFNRWYYCVFYPSPQGVSFYVRDVTDQKEAESKLIESEKQYRLLFENNPLPMWVLELKSLVILDVNNAAIRHYGYSRDEFIGKNVLELRPKNEEQRFMDYNKARPVGHENAGIWTHVKKDGTEIKVEILSYNINYGHKDCRLIIANDITEKIKNENELRNSRDQLRMFSDHLENAREEERSSIAREIHDQLGQQLTGIKMDISWLSRKLKNDQDGVKEKIAGMLELVDDTVKSVRKIASELRPGILDELGLTAALDWQANEFAKRSGINCNFQSDMIEEEVDKNISIGVYRIMQEALTNVARHSKATQVKCTLSSDGDEIKLAVIDNGQGMADDNMNKKTLGLLGMRERALMMKGNLLIESAPGKGTNIQLTVPLKLKNQIIN